MVQLREVNGKVIADEGYFEWLKSLKPGDEVAYKQNSYWRKKSVIQVVAGIDQKNKVLILANGERINIESGRQVYCKSSYRDNDVHVTPVTETLRYEVQLERACEQYREATDRKDLTITEMGKIVKFINKLVTSRKSHIPVVDGDS